MIDLAAYGPDPSSDSEMDDDVPAQGEHKFESPEGKRLTMEKIRAELERLRVQKSHRKTELYDICAKIKAVATALQHSRKQLSQLGSCLKSICIHGRNIYSMRAIQNDFARGIKE